MVYGLQRISSGRAALGSLAASVLLASIGSLGGCTQVSERSRFERTDQTLEVLASAPRLDATDVDPRSRVDLCLSGWADPRSVDEVDATVSSGGAIVDSELTVQLVPWLAPGLDLEPEQTLAPWCEGSVLSVRPRATLAAGVRYRVRLLPSAVGWAGETLDTEGPQWTANTEGEPRYTLEFTVDDLSESPPFPPEQEPPEPTSLVDLFTDGGPFDPARDTCSCHRDADSVALARLDLRDPTAAYEDLLGSARPRDTGFPMVAPRDPSQSFLVQKLLRDPEGHALHGVLGDPMPPDEPLPYVDALAIMRWIIDGAEP